MSSSPSHRLRCVPRPAKKPPAPAHVDLGDAHPSDDSSNSHPRNVHPRELTTKRRGELAELAFLHKATALGFRLSKPYGDSDRYDFITDAGNLLYRVQVKCTTQLLGGYYHLNAHRRINGKAVPYTLDEIDFFGALIVPEDTWFIIPLSHVLGMTSFLLRSKHTRTPRDPFRRYREA